MEENFAQSNVEKNMIKKCFEKQQPICATLELTPLCNMNCEMCYVHLSKDEMNEKGKLLTTEEWLSIIDQLEHMGVLFVLLTGGEPLLYPGFKQIYLKLKEKGMIITINTNGTLLNEQWIDFFDKNRPRRMNITLYGSNEETYQKLCHFSKGYQKAIKAINLLKEKNIDIKINSSATKVNKNDLNQIYEIGNQYHVPVHTDTYMIPSLHENQIRLLPKEAAQLEVQLLKKELSEENYKKYIHQCLESIKSQKNIYDNITCLAGNCSFAVNWQGMMQPCLNLNYPSISLKKYTIEEGWKKISVQSKTINLNNKCKQCNLRPICKNCVACAKLECGFTDGKPDYLCEYSNEFVHLIQIEKAKFK